MTFPKIHFAPGIFKKLKALDISLIIYHWEVLSSLIFNKNAEETLIILHKGVIFQEMPLLIWSVQRSHRLKHSLQIMTSSTYI